MKHDRSDVVLVLIGGVVVIWASLLVAPTLELDRSSLFVGLSSALNDPLCVHLVSTTPQVIFVGLIAYVLGVTVYFATRKNWRRGEEHGSAKWGKISTLTRKYKDRRFENNIILTKNFLLSLDENRHRRNLNVLVVGGSGAGKTRGYAKPNVMQANTSMVVLDSKGTILRDTGHLLKTKGYEIRVLDLVNPHLSHCFNPFNYLQSDNDVQRLTTNLFKATTPKGTTPQDPFWDSAASMLHLALAFYLFYEAPAEEQNYPMLMEMLRAGEVREDDDEYVSILDELFARLEMRQPDHIALKYYRNYHSGSAKTLKSIQVTLAARLEKFNLASIASLSSTDELDLGSLGERKVALFAIIPDNDTSFNFLVSILYTQLFQHLFRLADTKYKGELPVHVHFVMDEFANVSLPDDFEKILSVMRSRSVSASIILQNLAQLKALFEKQWESIVGNCDEFLFLGGNEQSTHKYVSELLGKETIDTTTFGKSIGKSGSYTTNYQIAGRELLTPDEVRMLDNSKALLFIRGERALMDAKYDITKHPLAKLTTDGGWQSFEHGQDRLSIGGIKLFHKQSEAPPTCTQISTSEAEFTILCNEEVEVLFNIA